MLYLLSSALSAMPPSKKQSLTFKQKKQKSIVLHITLSQVDADCPENVVFLKKLNKEEQNHTSDFKFVIGEYLFCKIFSKPGYGQNSP